MQNLGRTRETQNGEPYSFQVFSDVKFAEKRYLENYTLGKKGVDWIDAKLNNINLLRETVREQQTTEVLFIE